MNWLTVSYPGKAEPASHKQSSQGLSGSGSSQSVYYPMSILLLCFLAGNLKTYYLKRLNIYRLNAGGYLN